MAGKSLSVLLQESSDLIGDPLNAFFSTALITEWINFAIDDLSAAFPRVIVYEMSCTTDQFDYDLESNFLAALSVEYPKDEDPPIFLLRKSVLDPSFYLHPGYYDILQTHDSSSANPPVLKLSENPTTGESINLTYSAVHNHLSGPTDTVTIFDRHTHLIALFTRWKAYQYLATTEGMDPDPVKLLSATVEVNAYRAERAYYEALRRAQKSESASSAIITPWKSDRFDQVY